MDDDTINKLRNEYRLLHTMIRVQDLDRSIDFYTRILGMKVIRRKDYKDGEFTNVVKINFFAWCYDEHIAMSLL